MELETKIHEQLALRARKRREELQRQASRYSNAVEAGALRNENDVKHIEILKELETANSRRGFLTSRLQLPTLTLLQRWQAQLQLLEKDARLRSDRAASSESDKAGNAGVATLENPLLALNSDRPCFDIGYASTIRIGDLKEKLFETSEQQLRVNEALAFSSTQDGYTVRVVLFTLEGSSIIQARSSLFVLDLDSRIQSVSNESGNASALVNCLWEGCP